MKKIISLSIISVILIAGCIGSNSPYVSERYKKAENISVYPNEGSLRFTLLSPNVQKVTIAYIPNETENVFYAASTIELTLKLGLIYRGVFQGERDVDTYKPDDNTSCLVFYSRKVPNVFQEKCFSSIEVNTELDAFSLSSAEEPVILLLGPSQTNRTIIEVDDYLVKVEGSKLSKNRTDSDLDIAVAKLILTLAQSESE